ncbi:MAG: MFS transporter [Dehalococcoidales bacterium]|nr:MFS transporter [Dehalococcoidales bacterium]
MPIFSRYRERPEYGWVIVGVFLMASLIIIGIRLSFGVFFKSIAAEFGLNRAATSAVFSVYMALGCVFAILGGWLLDRYGPRRLLFMMGICTGLALLLTSQAGAYWQLFLTFSLPMAVGGGAIFTVSTSTISRWFERRRSLALGVSLSGAGLGAVVISPLSAYLISALDWRWAYAIIGIIALLVVLPLSRLLTVQRGKAEAVLAASGSEDQDRPLVELLRNRNFYLIFSDFFLFGICLFVIYTHLVPHATDIGVTEEQAATIMSVLGFASVVGRVLLGYVADRFSRRLTAVFCLLIQAVSLVGLIWAQSLWAFYLFALGFGLGLGGIGPTTAALAGDIFGLRRIGFILGILDVGFGIGSAAGPIFAGFIFDVTHSYQTAFVVCVILSFANALLIGLIREHREQPG